MILYQRLIVTQVLSLTVSNIAPHHTQIWHLRSRIPSNFVVKLILRKEERCNEMRSEKTDGSYSFSHLITIHLRLIRQTGDR